MLPGSHDADTMSGRVQKSKDLKSVLRSACDDVFERFGSSDVMPYTRCFRAKRPYYMAEGFKVCYRCKNLKRPCDGLVVALSRKSRCVFSFMGGF